MAKCINLQCGQEAGEYERCVSCETDHKKHIEELDKRPVQKFEKIPTPIASIRKIVSSGVVVTISTLEPMKFNG